MTSDLSRAADSPAVLRNWQRVLLALALLVIWFGTLDLRTLAEPDEGRYAEIPREMAATGDYVTPRLNGLKYFEKPPLQYWITAAAFELFGFHEWTARWWPPTAGMLGVLTLWFAGRRLFDAATGAASALILASTAYYVFLSQWLVLDMGLTFFLTVALCAFLLAQQPPAGSLQTRGWMLIAWAAAALGVLSKGVVAAALPVLALVVYSTLHRDLSPWRRLHVLPGLALFLLIAAPWFVQVSLRNPEFPEFFFVREHFARFTTTVHQRAEPFWYFLPVLLLGLLPWTGVVLEGLRDAWRAGRARRAFSAERFLVVWAACVVGFFSISSSKMAPYVLPAVPALALVGGLRIARLEPDRALKRVLPLLLLMGALLLVGGVVLAYVKHKDAQSAMYLRFGLWLALTGILVLASAPLAARIRRSKMAALVAVGFAALVAIQLALLGYENLVPLRSAHLTAQDIKPYLRPDTVVFSVGRYDQTLPPYLGRTVVLVEVEGELKFGIEQEPQRALPNLALFAEAWSRAPHAIAVMEESRYQAAAAQGLPMTVISQSRQRITVRRPD